MARNPLRALRVYVLPLAIGGGLAAALALFVMDPGTSFYPTMRDQDVYPEYSAVSGVLESVALSADDMPAGWRDYGRGVGLRAKWLNLDDEHALYYTTRGLDAQGRRFALEFSSGFGSQETTELVFSGSFLYAEASTVASELAALATLDDTTLFQLVAEPGDRFVARTASTPLALGDGEIGFAFAYDRPFGELVIPLRTEIRLWHRGPLLAFVWTTKTDNSSPPQTALTPLAIMLDDRLDAALTGWDNPFVFNASSPAGADRGANQRGA